MKSETKGKVYLVGAGPGDETLISLKGLELLQQADAIVHDHLISPTLSRFFSPHSQIYFVGKSGSDHTVEQPQINRLLIQLARRGKQVVRLKGGDPFIFGRGGEEIGALRKARIPCEIIPGITAALSAAASLQIPLTHRDFSSSVTFLTGHGQSHKKMDYASLVKTDGTLVFYMAAKQLFYIVEQLLKAGMKPNMPAALVRFVTWSQEETIFTSLKAISKKGKSFSKPPVLLIIGEVVKFGKKTNVKQKSLEGVRVLVTRAPHQASVLSEKLRSLGAIVLEQPLIQIQKVKDWKQVDREIEKLSYYDWVIFTSANGVSFFIERLKEKGKDGRSFGSSRLAVIGPATAKALEVENLRADCIPPSFVAESLADQLMRSYPLMRKHILLVRGDLRRPVLKERLEKAGALVREITVYETKIISSSGTLQKLIQNQVDYITVTSSSTAQSLINAVGKKVLKKVTRKVKIASIGPITTSTLKKEGIGVKVQAREFTLDGLVQAIVKDARKKKR